MIWRVPATSVPIRFDQAVTRHNEQLSRSAVLKLIKGGYGYRNGKRARAGELVKPGDQLELKFPEVEVPQPATVPVLHVYYQDDDVLVLEKPSGMNVHPGNGHRSEASAADFARTKSTDPDPDRPGIVHRLDRDTSGLLVIARTANAKAWLQHQWQTRRVTKRYLLLVIGRLDAKTATINLPLGRDPKRPLRQAVVAGGRAAVTRYHVLQEYPGYSLVEAWPETGRTHQLRVHFAAVGHPIVGDTTYGPINRPLGLTRQFLHATQLTLVVPSGTQHTFDSPLPSELQEALNGLDNGI